MAEMNTMKTNARHWWGVCYPENMVDNWQTEIGDLVGGLAYCYAIHNEASKDNEHKEHVHLIVVFSNTTTYKHALGVFNRLSVPGKVCCNTIQQVINIRHSYDYLIHDTETCRQKNKILYDPKIRVCGNNFDIGILEQLGKTEKLAMVKELCDFISDNMIDNFLDFYNLATKIYCDDSSYFEVLSSYSGLFERMTKAVWFKYKYDTKQEKQ